MTNIQLVNIVGKLIDLLITQAISTVEVERLVALRNEIFSEKK